jgi:hypothetical protein
MSEIVSFSDTIVNAWSETSICKFLVILLWLSNPDFGRDSEIVQRASVQLANSVPQKLSIPSHDGDESC